jgi:hypothetical protein
VRVCRSLCLCVVAALAGGCSFLADEFLLLDRAAPAAAPADAAAGTVDRP